MFDERLTSVMFDIPGPLRWPRGNPARLPLSNAGWRLDSHALNGVTWSRSLWAIR